MSKSKSTKEFKPYACLAADYNETIASKHAINSEIKNYERANIHKES